MIFFLWYFLKYLLIQKKKLHEQDYLPVAWRVENYYADAWDCCGFQGNCSCHRYWTDPGCSIQALRQLSSHTDLLLEKMAFRGLQLIKQLILVIFLVIWHIIFYITYITNLPFSVMVPYLFHCCNHCSCQRHMCLSKYSSCNKNFGLDKMIHPPFLHLKGKSVPIPEWRQQFRKNQKLLSNIFVLTNILI